MIRTAHFPLKIFVGYILFTLAVSFFGPVKYEAYDRVSVAFFMAAFLVVFSAGYHHGVRKPIARRGKSRPLPASRVMGILKVCILIAFAAKSITLFAEIAKGGFSLAPADMGQRYVDVYDGYVRNSGAAYSASFLLNLPLTLPVQTAMILGAYHYRQLPRAYRVMTVCIFLFVLLANTLGQGKQKQFGDIVIFLMGVGLLKLFDGGRQPRISGAAIRKFAVFGFLATTIFAYIIKTRYAAIGVTAENYNSRVVSQIWLDLEHPVFAIFGLDWGFALSILLTGYLSAGYYGLSLCLSIPFKWTYCLGTSYSVMVIANRIFGVPFMLEETYPLRMEAETGYAAMSKWHTVFPWVASDFTFPGSLLVFYLVARVYATTWVEAIRDRNPVSILFFCVLTLGMVFVPANNQLMIAPDSIIALWLLAFVWFLRRGRYPSLIPAGPRHG